MIPLEMRELRCPGDAQTDAEVFSMRSLTRTAATVYVEVPDRGGGCTGLLIYSATWAIQKNCKLSR